MWCVCLLSLMAFPSFLHLQLPDQIGKWVEQLSPQIYLNFAKAKIVISSFLLFVMKEECSLYSQCVHLLICCWILMSFVGQMKKKMLGYTHEKMQFIECFSTQLWPLKTLTHSQATAWGAILGFIVLLKDILKCHNPGFPTRFQQETRVESCWLNVEVPAFDDVNSHPYTVSLAVG